VLRAVTDEIMYAVMNLSGQVYVDEYAQRAKKRAKPGSAAAPGNAATPVGAATPDDAAQEAVPSSTPGPS